MQEKPRRIDSPRPIVGKPLIEVIDIKNRHEERLRDNQNTLGVDICFYETEENRQIGMRVYLKEQPTLEQCEAMEKSIEEVPVVYLTVGVIRAGV